jgi:hypothetical protein
MNGCISFCLCYCHLLWGDLLHDLDGDGNRLDETLMGWKHAEVHAKQQWMTATRKMRALQEEDNI